MAGMRADSSQTRFRICICNICGIKFESLDPHSICGGCYANYRCFGNYGIDEVICDICRRRETCQKENKKIVLEAIEEAKKKGLL